MTEMFLQKMTQMFQRKKSHALTWFCAQAAKASRLQYRKSHHNTKNRPKILKTSYLYERFIAKL